jgi:hypothetical protein
VSTGHAAGAPVVASSDPLGAVDATGAGVGVQNAVAVGDGVIVGVVVGVGAGVGDPVGVDVGVGVGVGVGVDVGVDVGVGVGVGVGVDVGVVVGVGVGVGVGAAAIFTMTDAVVNGAPKKSVPEPASVTVPGFDQSAAEVSQVTAAAVPGPDT